MFKKLQFLSFKAWLLNGWYYVRFYILAYMSNYFKVQQANSKNKPGYTLVFSDEFNDPTIDWKKWSTCEPFGCTREDSKTHQPELIYKQEQVEVHDYCAVLTSAVNEQPTVYTEYENQTAEPLVKSGALNTWQSFAQQYGWFETREQLPPHGFDNWASFWGYPLHSWPPEIDVFELMGANSSFITMTMHYADWTTNKKQIDEIFSQINMKYGYYPKDVDDAIAFLRDPWTQERQNFIDSIIAQRIVQSRSRRLKFPKSDFLAQGFHTYALEWTEKKVVWHIDNTPVYILDKHMPTLPFHWLITNAIKDHYVTPPATLPMQVKVDYFRAYKKD